MAAPLLTRCSVFAAKTEATVGTPETLTLAEGRYNVFNFEMLEETDYNARAGQGGFSPIPGVIGPRSGRAKFETELHGSGASGTGADWATVLLKACGFAASGAVYTPLSCTTNPVMATIGHFEAGRLRRLAGSQGTVTLNCRSGFPVKASWEFLGGYVAPSSLALISPDYPNIIAPRFVGATFTIGGTSFPLTSVDIAVNNTLVLRPDATSTTGIRGSVITGRNITVTCDPEALLYGTKDWNTDWTASTLSALNMVVGSAAGNTITIACPKLQLSAAPNPGSRDGLMTDQLTFTATRNADAGDDEMTITLS